MVEVRKMTKVYCPRTDCAYCRPIEGNSIDGLCGRDEIMLDGDLSCFSYDAYTEKAPEYQEVFWKRIMSRSVAGRQCRKKATGKRYEKLGLTWFTDEDDRRGTAGLMFTEEVSGLGCKAEFINEGNLDRIRKSIKKAGLPVIELPEATPEDL